MASTIRIKRSSVSGNPATLAAGELAYSALTDNGSNGGDRLYIGIGTETGGNAANHFVIGGKFFTDRLDHTAGTLTANSAIVVDNDSKIDVLNVDNLRLDGNTLSTQDVNGNLILNPNGTGKISFYSAYSFPRTDGSAGYALVTDGAGNISWAGVSTANTATNIAGGTAGQVPYQSAPGVTSFYGPGTAGQLLVSNGASAPVYTNTSSIYVGRSVDADKWIASRTLTLAGDLSGNTSFDGSVNFTLTATVNTSTLYVNRAVTADKWTTARTITFTGDTTGTFSIDGSADITNVNLTIQPDSVALGTDTTGDYVATGATSGFGISGSTSGETQTFTVSSNATSSNVVSTIVFRDGSGNFSAGTITADLTGTATNATKWLTARTVTFTGDTTGTFIIDGSADVTNVNLTIQPDSVALGTDTTGDYVALGATSGFGISGSTSGENQTFTVTANSTSSNTVGTIVFRDNNGGFDVGNIEVKDTTTATSTTSGALQVVGGAGIGESLYVGNKLVVQSTLASTGSVTENALYVAGGIGIDGSLYVKGPAYFDNNVVFSGTSTYVYSTNTVYTDNIINLHTPAGSTGTDHTWAVDDGKDIGFVFHYYSNQDKDAFLGLAQDTGYLEWYSNGLEDLSTGIFTGTEYGIFKAGGIRLVHTTASNSTNTGALTVEGGVGIGGDLYVGGTINGTIAGAVSSATNLVGGAANQIVYQSAPGTTAFLPVGGYGQVLQVINTSTGEFAWGDIDGGTY